MGFFSSFMNKIHNIKYPSVHYQKITYGMKIITFVLFGAILIYQLYTYIIIKIKLEKNEVLDRKLHYYMDAINSILFILYIVSMIIPCLFILYMKKDYIFDSKKLHYANKDKYYRSIKNQIYVDNLIWWNTLYILLFFILIFIERYVSSPVYEQILKKSYAFLDV